VRAAAALVAAVAVALIATGCGYGGDEDPRLTVSAASSLKGAFTGYGEDFPDADVRLSFAGSNQLAAQIRAGARPDVFAAASTLLLRKLFEEGLVEEPVEFAYNRLVVAVPKDGSVKTFADLADRGVRIAVGTASVPIGSYARAALAQLPGSVRRRVEANIETEEPDAASVVGRVRAGVVDAGIVYRTDVRAVSELRGLEMPVRVRPAYAAAVVRGRDDHGFVEGLTGRRAREPLQRAGFELPPP